MVRRTAAPEGLAQVSGPRVIRPRVRPRRPPTSVEAVIGHVHATEQTTRGFHVILWRDGDLGYALVSDLDPRELETLAGKIVGG